MVIIDTGATYDMLNKWLAEACFPATMRELLKATKINMANGKAAVDKGVSIRSGPWDCITDAMMMKNLPNLTAVGQRTMHVGFSFIWIRGQPCALFLPVVLGLSFTTSITLYIFFAVYGAV